ncbi:ciliary microtubule inner protein 5-like isoform X2 [Clavelina lepadiformis]|uniref:ciliary microtubule inner protein 5-like isoform X2 n=1 Tax=Clavelina lepadiformis TaxID=159417 RepID=UPI0040426412
MSSTRPEAIQTSAPSKASKREIEKCDEVSFNKIWREQIQSEWKGVHEWNKNWGFTTNYDPRGCPKAPKELPERESVFSDKIASTQGHVYGSRVYSDIGKQMTNMEFMFHSSNRKCRMGNEFMCY